MSHGQSSTGFQYQLEAAVGMIRYVLATIVTGVHRADKKANAGRGAQLLQAYSGSDVRHKGKERSVSTISLCY